MADLVVDVLINVYLRLDELIVPRISHVMGVGIVHHGRVTGIAPCHRSAVALQKIDVIGIHAEISCRVVLIDLLTDIVNPPVLSIQKDHGRPIRLNIGVHGVLQNGLRQGIPKHGKDLIIRGTPQDEGFE